MFRIRRIFDDVSPRDARAVAQAKALLRAHFSGFARHDIGQLPSLLRHPLKHRFRATLFVAEDHGGDVTGVALLLHEAFLRFCYLEFIAVAASESGKGIGGALYDRVRREAVDLNTLGIFFECLPDDPKLSRDPVIRRQNRSRLRFYEKYGARPVINTMYEAQLEPGADNVPYLCYDNLGQQLELSRDAARAIVRAILERKYGSLVTAEYIDMVVNSFNDDPVKLRAFKYVKKAPILPMPYTPKDKRIVLVVNEQHIMHHIEERGYVEAPPRIDAILKELDKTRLFDKVKARRFPEKHISEAHTFEFVSYLRRVCKKLDHGQAVYPYVFPIRNKARPPVDLPLRAGYYCIDTFTPLTHHAYLAARRAVDCALTCAESILDGHRIAYALVRPPGHHAERSSFGGFCYLNSTAAASDFLSKSGRVAVLDIDHHHGNGTQDIFYRRSDVFTVSIHGHPRDTYPYFSGYADEKGEDEGKGYNLNMPLPGNVDGRKYRAAMSRALRKVIAFKPRFVVVALGLDIAKDDPTGQFVLETADFESIGNAIGALRKPLLVVQEGGYDTAAIGVNAAAFFKGLWNSVYSA